MNNEIKAINESMKRAERYNNIKKHLEREYEEELAGDNLKTLAGAVFLVAICFALGWLLVGWN